MTHCPDCRTVLPIARFVRKLQKWQKFCTDCEWTSEPYDERPEPDRMPCGPSAERME